MLLTSKFGTCQEGGVFTSALDPLKKKIKEIKAQYFIQ